MSKALQRLKERAWIEVGFALVLVVAASWLGYRLQSKPAVLPPPSAATQAGSLTDSQKEALKIFGELEKLLLSLTGLLIGGVVTIVAKDGLLRPPPPRPARLLLIATFGAAASSMYFGYFTYIRLLEILEYGYFSVNAQQLSDPLTWQYRLFMTAVLGLATFAMLAWFGVKVDTVTKSEEKGDKLWLTPAFVLLVLTPLWADEGPRSVSECDSPEAGVSAPSDLASVLVSWASAHKLTIPDKVQQQLAAEYLCVESVLRKAFPTTPSEELRAAGLETVNEYLNGFLKGEPKSFAVLFSRRLGLTGFVQSRPRRYSLVTIVTDPKKAAAALDGTLIPEKRCLATVGQHELTATLTAYRSCQRSVEVKAGEAPQEIRCKLNRVGH